MPANIDMLKMQNQTEQLEKMEGLCQHIFFQTEEGRELLKLLENIYILQTPIFNQDCKKWGIDAHDYCLMREGQNQMIRNLTENATNYLRRLEVAQSKVDQNMATSEPTLDNLSLGV